MNKSILFVVIVGLLMGICSLFAFSAKADSRPIAGAYLWNLAYDQDISGPAGKGSGDWTAYKTWLGVSALAVEADPGWGTGDWWDCCQHTGWNSPWGAQQAKYGASLPVVILGLGQMPWDPSQNDSWDQKLAWENKEWQLEASNDPATMAYFASYSKDIDNGASGFPPFRAVIIRLGYEFDGGWNPFGNLNVMSHMPENYISAWRNIVSVMRANDPKHIIKGFLWNPTDGNVQIDQFAYYPGDAYVDYIGFDEYDFCYNGDYSVSASQPSSAQQASAWKDAELPRIDAFAGLSLKHGNKPIIVGEWGLWQLNDRNHPSGGDNPSYIQHMHDWMRDPKNNVYLEVYFETPSDGDSQLWPGGSGPSWGHGTAFPNAAKLYRSLFGAKGKLN